MASENVKLNGLEELVETINNLGQFAKYASPFIRNAVDKGAEVIQKAAIENAQQLKHKKGAQHIADNIAVQRTWVTKDGQWLARVGVKREAFHANPVERGHIVRSKKGYRYVAAQPFLSPAFESQKNVAMADIEYELRRSMPDIMKIIARKKARMSKK
jgi:HK97 gp10 family phage protein